MAIAANDDMRSPKEKDVLNETFAKAHLPVEIEVSRRLRVRSRILNDSFRCYWLIGIITCAPAVPASISQGSPCPFNAPSRWLTVDTPIDSGVANGTDITHNRLITPSLLESR